MPLWKAVAFAAGLGLSMLSYPVHAAPASGGETVQGLYKDGIDGLIAALDRKADILTAATARSF